MMREKSAGDCREVHMFRSNIGHRRGFVGLLILLISVAIGMVIYFMMIKAVMPDIGSDRQDKAKVWDQEWRLDPASPERQKEAKKTAKWLDIKPQIAEETTLQGEVQLAGEARGKIELVFTKDGKVKGKWDAKYDHENIEYNITAEFKGVTDPTNTFSEGATARPDLLYFITKGTYLQKSLDTKNGQQSEQRGIAYAAGWLNIADAARGEITLTTDKTWSAVYSYNAAKE
jgi:hypothetical protein